GTPLRLTGEQGQTLWQGQADDWGAIDQEQGETDQPIRFQGQYRDEESGLYYNRYRYYAAELGRYVTQDPIGLKGGSNAYMYVDAAPLLIVDPLGQDGISISGTLQIPFASYAHQFGIADIPITGVEIGAAITFPGPWNPSAEFDIGIFGGGNTEMEFGLGRASVDAGYSSAGSLCDYAGVSGSTGAIIGPISTGVTYDPSLETLESVKLGGAFAPSKTFKTIYEAAGAIIKNQSLKKAAEVFYSNALTTGGQFSISGSLLNMEYYNVGVSQ
ncbi:MULTISPECIES: RHS repeat-associated core domain-containing protein, partial [unclassified Pseudomonas]|uniref:RHS repeat-associated core domain-containing protein n=1 Tax=unclassified Pseudomonas TaxID=196821 RepID=UPI00244C9858